MPTYIIDANSRVVQLGIRDHNNYFQKRAAEVLKFVWDFTALLNGDTIAGSATLSVPAGLTASGAATNTSTAVTQKISGGTVGTQYTVTCTVTTTTGAETYKREIIIDVVAA